MQHTLTFKHDNKKYVSKPFDFEAMCIINDAHNDENKNGLYVRGNGRNAGYY